MDYLRLSNGPWLTLLWLTPLVGMLLIGVGGLLRLDDRLIKRGAVVWSLVPLGIAVVTWQLWLLTHA